MPRVYFERLLVRPEYISKDSSRAQSIFQKTPDRRPVIHMEHKDLHVAIVLSPICGPIASRAKNCPEPEPKQGLEGQAVSSSNLYPGKQTQENTAVFTSQAPHG